MLLGHSAGGHLALWASYQRVMLDTRAPVRSAVCALAPVTHLGKGHLHNLGSGVIGALLGGSHQSLPERYTAASPYALLPLGVPQLLLHGLEDHSVPIDMTRSYAHEEQKLGDSVTLVEFPGVVHFEHLDPESDSWLTVRNSSL